MGSQICKQGIQQSDLMADPLFSEYQKSSQFEIDSSLNLVLDKIKNLRNIIDPRQNYALNWYSSKQYKFKLYGLVKWRKPCGQCLFYFKYQPTDIQSDRQASKHIYQKTPLLITSHISQNYTFSSNTLIIYPNRSYYIGQISTKTYQIPKANGQGLLVTKQFIYQGEFKDGKPCGYGRYRTKIIDFLGFVNDGIPLGQSMQRTAQGLFVGTIDQQSKRGFLITPDNKRLQTNHKINNNQQPTQKLTPKPIV